MVVHTVPSTLAFSPVGRYVSPALAGVGRQGPRRADVRRRPDPASTPEFLSTSTELGWHATFFMLGDMVRAAPGLAAEVAAAGHEVAVHADTHRSQKTMGPRAIRDDVRPRHDAVADGVRGGAGVVPAAARGALARGQGHGPAARDAVRALDDLGPGLAGRGDARVRAAPTSCPGWVDGGTVLLHDSDCTSDPGAWRSTVGGLRLLAAGFADRGLSVGPVGEHGVARKISGGR